MTQAAHGRPADLLRKREPGETALSDDEKLYGLALGLIKPPGIESIEHVRERCRIDDSSGCWIWAGAVSDGVPRIWATNLRTGKRGTMPGRQAAWMLKHQMPVPPGWRVFAECSERMCVNPEHSRAMAVAKRGQKVAASGKLKGSIRRAAVNRRLAQKRTSLTHEALQQIRSAPRGKVLTVAKQYGIGRTAAYRARSGQTCLDPVGGMFSQLLAGGA